MFVTNQLDELPSKTEGTTRFVCMSDTHGKTAFRFNIPDGDVFSKSLDMSTFIAATSSLLLYIVHAGDLTRYGGHNEYESTINWLKSLPHK